MGTDEVEFDGLQLPAYVSYELTCIRKALDLASVRLTKVEQVVADRVGETQTYVAHLRKENDRLQARISSLLTEKESV